MIEKKSFENQLYRLGLVTLLLPIFGDIFSDLSILIGFSFYRYSALSKILILVILPLFVIRHFQFYRNKKSFKLICIIILLIILYLISNFLLINEPPFSLLNVEYLIRYLYLPLILVVFTPLFQNRIAIQRFFFIYELFFLFNLILIVLGALFDISIFESYPNPNRFGFSGVMNRTTQISYMVILFVMTYYYKVFFQREKAGLKLGLLILISLLIGTKKIYFFYGILGLFHLIEFRNRISLKQLFLGILMAITTLVLFGGRLKEMLFDKFGIFIQIYREDGFLASLTSYRSENLRFLVENTLLKTWRGVNYLVGGCDFTVLRAEMEFVDVFLFFGLFGVLIYIFF